LQNISQPESLFLQLDTNVDGEISATESATQHFSHLASKTGQAFAAIALPSETISAQGLGGLEKSSLR